MAVKDRTKPIQAVVTKSPAKYLGPQTLLGLTRHLVQVSCEGVLITAWLTEEDFEKGFENVPEAGGRPRVDPRKPIRQRPGRWSTMTQNNTVSVECLWSIDIDSGEHHFVKLTFQSGRVMAKYWPDRSFQAAFENVPEESPVASVTVDGETLAGVKSVDIECDNGAAPEPHEGNGEFQPEIDWKGEVECRPRNATGRRYCWRPFRVHHWCEEMSDSVIGTQPTHWQPYTYLFADWEFRNKPQPEPVWESAGDDRSCHKEDVVLWQVWVQYPHFDTPVVCYTSKSRIKALGYQQKVAAACLHGAGARYRIASCKAPVMPDAAEVGA